MLLGHRLLLFIDTDIAVIMGSDVSVTIYICMSDLPAVEQRPFPSFSAQIAPYNMDSKCFQCNTCVFSNPVKMWNQGTTRW